VAETLAPMKAVSGELPPAGEAGWVFELKWDGYRTLAVVDAGTVRLVSANGHDATRRWPALGALAGSVNATSAVIDGETVALDPEGRPRFELLQAGEAPVVFLAFDLLELNGHAVTELAWQDRRRLLEQVLEPGPAWGVSPVYDDSADLVAVVEAQGLEGIVAKRSDSQYLPGRRSATWRKVKFRRRQEFVIGGYTSGTGGRSASFGAVLVGVHDGPSLRYCGAVGTGFDRRTLDALLAEFAGLATDACPFDPPPPHLVARHASWVRPVIVCEVAFAEWTSDGLLRQPAYLGRRDDKDAADVVREPG
jgi:bifunctional non-homologous end joining protein LigD